MRLTPGEKKYPDQAVWALAEFDPKTCELKLPDAHSYVDYGLDLYAPQTTLDAEGRRVMISWMRMPMAVTDSTAVSYTHLITPTNSVCPLARSRATLFS